MKYRLFGALAFYTPMEEFSIDGESAICILLNTRRASDRDGRRMESEWNKSRPAINHSYGTLSTGRLALSYASGDPFFY